MKLKTIIYKGKVYQRIAVCLFIGTKTKFVLCSTDNKANEKDNQSAL